MRACGGVGMSIGLGCFNLREPWRHGFDGLEQDMSVSGTSDLKNGKLVQITRENLD
ncbi:MAG: hypothetical protein V9H26_05640 [Verrucomicrobiota bacterium]